MRIFKYIVFFIFVLLMWVPPAFFGIPTNYEPWYEKVFNILLFAPLVVAFIYGWFLGKKIYPIIGLCCLIANMIEQVSFAGYTAGLVGGATGDVFGYWEAYGDFWSQLLLLIIFTTVPSFFSYIGGLIRERPTN